ncbi:unnamed protein product [Amoebophrya sp. A120]|nr:unnamed protein product [Amoebophrya sp. A120]|eukprot:GSA120T00010481001.1
MAAPAAPAPGAGGPALVGQLPPAYQHLPGAGVGPPGGAPAGAPIMQPPAGGFDIPATAAAGGPPYHQPADLHFQHLGKGGAAAAAAPMQPPPTGPPPTGGAGQTSAQLMSPTASVGSQAKGSVHQPKGDVGGPPGSSAAVPAMVVHPSHLTEKGQKMLLAKGGSLVQVGGVLPGTSATQGKSSVAPPVELDPKQTNKAGGNVKQAPSTSAEEETKNAAPSATNFEDIMADVTIAELQQADDSQNPLFNFKTNDGKKFRYGDMIIDPGSDSEPDEHPVEASKYHLGAAGSGHQQTANGGGGKKYNNIRYELGEESDQYYQQPVAANQQQRNNVVNNANVKHQNLVQYEQEQDWSALYQQHNSNKKHAPAAQSTEKEVQAHNAAASDKTPQPHIRYNPYHEYEKQNYTDTSVAGQQAATAQTAGGAAAGRDNKHDTKNNKTVQSSSNQTLLPTACFEFVSDFDGQIVGPLPLFEQKTKPKTPSPKHEETSHYSSFDKPKPATLVLNKILNKLPKMTAVRRTGDKFFVRVDDFVKSNTIGQTNSKGCMSTAKASSTSALGQFGSVFSTLLRLQMNRCPVVENLLADAEKSQMDPYLKQLQDLLDEETYLTRHNTVSSKDTAAGGAQQQQQTDAAAQQGSISAERTSSTGTNPLPPLPPLPPSPPTDAQGSCAPQQVEHNDSSTTGSTLQRANNSSTSTAPFGSCTTVSSYGTALEFEDEDSRRATMASTNQRNTSSNPPRPPSSAGGDSLYNQNQNLLLTKNSFNSWKQTTVGENFLSQDAKHFYLSYAVGFYLRTLVNQPDLGFFCKFVTEEIQNLGNERLNWEERWINPLHIHFSQREIHPFFHGKGPVEEVIQSIWSEEVSLCGGKSSGVCSWNELAFGTNGPQVLWNPHLLTNQQPPAQLVASSGTESEEQDRKQEQIQNNYLQAKAENRSTVVGDKGKITNFEAKQSGSLANSVHLLYTPFPSIRVLLMDQDVTSDSCASNHFCPYKKLVSIDNRRLYALQRVCLDYWPKQCLVKVLLTSITSMSERRLKKEEMKFTHGVPGKYDGGRWANISSGRSLAAAPAGGGANAGANTGSESDSAAITTVNGTAAKDKDGAEKENSAAGTAVQQITQWESFDWCLQMKKKESQLLLRNICFPDVQNRELCPESQKAFSLLPFTVIAFLKHFEDSMSVNNNQPALLYRMQKDKASIVEYLNFGCSADGGSSDWHSLGTPGTAFTGASGHGIGNGKPADSTAAVPNCRNFGQAFQMLSEFYYEHYEKPLGLKSPKDRHQAGKPPRDPSRLLEFFGAQWLQRRNQYMEYVSATQKEDPYSVHCDHYHKHKPSNHKNKHHQFLDNGRNSAFEVNSFKHNALRQESRWRKELKSEWNLWGEYSDSVYYEGKKMKKIIDEYQYKQEYEGYYGATDSRDNSKKNKDGSFSTKNNSSSHHKEKLKGEATQQATSSKTVQQSLSNPDSRLAQHLFQSSGGGSSGEHSINYEDLVVRNSKEKLLMHKLEETDIEKLIETGYFDHHFDNFEFSSAILEAEEEDFFNNIDDGKVLDKEIDSYLDKLLGKDEQLTNNPNSSSLLANGNHNISTDQYGAGESTPGTTKDDESDFGFDLQDQINQELLGQEPAEKKPSKNKGGSTSGASSSKESTANGAGTTTAHYSGAKHGAGGGATTPSRTTSTGSANSRNDPTVAVHDKYNYNFFGTSKKDPMVNNYTASSSSAAAGRSPKSLEKHVRYWRPLVDIHTEFSKLAELFKVKQFLDVFVKRKWTLLHVKMLLWLCGNIGEEGFSLSGMSAGPAAGADGNIRTASAAGAPEQHSQGGSSDTAAANIKATNKQEVDVTTSKMKLDLVDISQQYADQNLLFGLHLQHMLYGPKQRLPDLGVMFQKTSKALITARGVQMTTIGQVEADRLPALVTTGSSTVPTACGRAGMGRNGLGSFTAGTGEEDAENDFLGSGEQPSLFNSSPLIASILPQSTLQLANAIYKEAPPKPVKKDKNAENAAEQPAKIHKLGRSTVGLLSLWAILAPLAMQDVGSLE